MTSYKDDWPKPRGRGDHLTFAEVGYIRRSFIARQKIEVTARELKCSSRTVAKYYGFFRAEGTVQCLVQPLPLPAAWKAPA